MKLNKIPVPHAFNTVLSKLHTAGVATGVFRLAILLNFSVVISNASQNDNTLELLPIPPITNISFWWKINECELL